MTGRDIAQQAGDYLAAEYLAHRPLDIMTPDVRPIR